MILAALHKAERYPTRSVEHLLAVTLLVWSLATAWPGSILVGPTYKYLLAIAPETFWGVTGTVFGAARLVALFINGRWRRTPLLRFIGAATGLIWWLVLATLYWLAVHNGADDFPMRHVFLVFMAFEAYSCFRCGQDHTAAREARSGG